MDLTVLQVYFGSNLITPIVKCEHLPTNNFIPCIRQDYALSNVRTVSSHKKDHKRG